VKRKNGASSFLYLKVTKDISVSNVTTDNFAFLAWNGQDRDFFWFEDGVVVGWGMNESDQQSLVKMLNLHSSSSILGTYPKDTEITSESPEANFDEERLSYEYGAVAQVDEKKDTIVLTKKNEWLEKVTYSIGLVRSVKLDEIEVEVESALTRALNLKFARATNIKSERGLKITGGPRAELAYLYNLSYNLTVKSRVMESPSILWDKPHSLHELYSKICTYLDIDSRVEVVQQKLKLPTNYWTLENEHSTSIISWRLEKMIIWLILVEVIFQILSKSEWWQNWSWEKGFRKLFGYPEPEPKHKTSILGDDYEIVSERYEIISPKSVQ